MGPAAALAAVTAACGEAAFSLIDKKYFIPIVMVVLVAVAVFVTMRPTLGTTIATHRPTQRKTVLVLLLSAGLIGLYDGLLGPGTGTFLVISFATLLGTELVRSEAMAKVINRGSTFGALASFACTGHVGRSLGLSSGERRVGKE